MVNYSGVAPRYLVLLLVSGLAVSGCQTARSASQEVPTAEGASAAIEPTGQGAESVVAGSLSEVDRRTRAVLAEMGLQVTARAMEDDAAEREYEARNGDRVVHVKLTAREASSTAVNVSSRERTLDYDKSHDISVANRRWLASLVLERVQQQR